MGARKEQLEKLLTTEEVAELLQIPVRTIKLYVATNDIPSIKIGRHRRFLPDEVLKWVRKQGS